MLRYDINNATVVTKTLDLNGNIHTSYTIQMIENKCRVSEDELRAWKVVMLNTFKPHHQIQEKLINGYSHLVKDDKLKNEINELIKHINGYKMVFGMWENNDYTRMSSWNNFPPELHMLVKKKIQELEKQIK